MNKSIKKMIKDIKRLSKECPKAGKEEMLDLLAIELDFDNAIKKFFSKKPLSVFRTDETPFYVHKDDYGKYYCDNEMQDSICSGSEAECMLYCMENNEVEE